MFKDADLLIYSTKNIYIFNSCKSFQLRDQLKNISLIKNRFRLGTTLIKMHAQSWTTELICTTYKILLFFFTINLMSCVLALLSCLSVFVTPRLPYWVVDSPESNTLIEMSFRQMIK